MPRNNMKNYTREAQPTMDAQPEPPRRESASTTLAQDVSFDERSFKLTTLAVESFGRLGEEGYQFIDEIATHAAGGTDGGSMAQEAVFKERLLLQTTRTSTGGGEKSRTSAEHINTNDLGLEC